MENGHLPCKQKTKEKIVTGKKKTLTPSPKNGQLPCNPKKKEEKTLIRRSNHDAPLNNEGCQALAAYAKKLCRTFTLSYGRIPYQFI